MPYFGKNLVHKNIKTTSDKNKRGANVWANFDKNAHGQYILFTTLLAVPASLSKAFITQVFPKFPILLEFSIYIIII